MLALPTSVRPSVRPTTKQDRHRTLVGIDSVTAFRPHTARYWFKTVKNTVCPEKSVPPNHFALTSANMPRIEQN